MNFKTPIKVCLCLSVAQNLSIFHINMKYHQTKGFTPIKSYFSSFFFLQPRKKKKQWKSIKGARALCWCSVPLILKNVKTVYYQWEFWTEQLSLQPYTEMWTRKLPLWHFEVSILQNWYIMRFLFKSLPHLFEYFCDMNL